MLNLIKKDFAAGWIYLGGITLGISFLTSIALLAMMDDFGGIVYESSRFMGLEQSNTSLVFNDKYVLKFFRRIFTNKNPDYEMNRFLTDKKDFKNTPKYCGSISFIGQDKQLITIAVMQELIPNQGDAWDYFLKEIDKVFETLKDKNINVYELPEPTLYDRLRIHDIPHRLIDWVGLNLFLKVKIKQFSIYAYNIC